jgi:nucleoside-diphosphate-sugar epimerase
MHFRSAAPSGRLDALRSRYPSARIEAAGANLLDRSALGPLVSGVDCLVHAAAAMRGSAADMFANTVVGTRNLLDAAGAAKVRRVVLISSFAVYRTEALADGAQHDENVPVETVGAERGSYAYAKTRQEHLFEEYCERFGFESIVMRPGVIYGPGTSPLSTRIGVRAFGTFFLLGGRATLPLTYVDNCADAIALAALRAPAGSAFNVVDDNLPTCADYLRQYRAQVEHVRVMPVPYRAFLFGARMLQRYHAASKGQLPAVFTPYVVRSMYRPLHYSNQALKAIGWTPKVSVAEGMQRTFESLAQQPSTAS